MIIQARPDWELDEEVSHCRLCDVKFNFWRRRHHCRDCVICGFCSLSRILLPHLGYLDPQRVCDACAKHYTLDVNGKKGRTASNWIVLLTKPELKKELDEKILKGIPSFVRPIIWQYMCGVATAMCKNKGVYDVLKSTRNDDLEEMLSHDVPRTFSEIPYFEAGLGKERLYNVLKAYGNFNSYSQYMTYLVGVLVMHMDEEESFWVFVQMMKQYNLDPIYKTRELFAETYSKILEAKSPNLYSHFRQQDFEVEMFVMSWIQTLFSQHFDLELVFRLWDIFFCAGFDMMIKFTLAILQSFEHEMLVLSGTDLLLYCQSLPSRVNDKDSIIVAASKIKLFQADIFSHDEANVPYN